MNQREREALSEVCVSVSLKRGARVSPSLKSEPVTDM